jgi:hypothetical protein
MNRPAGGRPAKPATGIHRGRILTQGLTVAAALLLLLAPAAATQEARPFHITVSPKQTFTSFSCTDPGNPFLCDVTATGELRSNLSTTPGTVDYTLVIDFSPGFDAPCNVVDETALFTFETGTITVHSHHQDCPATIRPGPRIVTDFQVTGGTGAFAGATGSGTEHGQSTIIYNGTIFV